MQKSHRDMLRRFLIQPNEEKMKKKSAKKSSSKCDHSSKKSSAKKSLPPWLMDKDKKSKKK